MPRHPTSKNGCAAIENGCANEMLFLVDISAKNNIFVVRKWMSRRPTSKNGCAAIENGCAAEMFFVDITEGPWGGKLQHFCAGYRQRAASAIQSAKIMIFHHFGRETIWEIILF